MTPEANARSLIDQKLEAAGWCVQDQKDLNLAAGLGVAVREYPTDTGPADYVLFVDREPVGVIEAKRDEAGENLTVHEVQTERDARSALKWRMQQAPLTFLYESTGQIIHFTHGRDPAPRARELFHFFRPRQLAAWRAESESLRRRLAEQMPPLPVRNLRDCQISAVTGLEKSLAMAKPRALVHMATGAGKTFTAITSVYRLLKFGGARRILFLVDTRNLGKQAHQEFMAYTPPDDGRKFTELYNVQRLASSNIDPHAQVCISTIQRMYSILSGDPIDESAEDLSLNELQQANSQAKLVRYNPAVPIEEFDFIVIDECHRSIYNLWKQVLDYFDAFLIGLTATPDKRTYGFFNENVVAEYSYEQSVVDGVNVGAFCKKVTYKAEEDPDSILANFRNDYHPRIAVTVDMIATGTDVKPLEVLLFMRDVRSKGYYEQMKGRGVRSLDAESLKKVSNSADSAKTHFVLIDAVGVEKSLKTESRPLEKKPNLSLDHLLKGIAVGSRDDDTVLSLGNRLVRLAKQLDDKAMARIKQVSGGIALNELARNLVTAVDPDRVVADALDAAKEAGITRSEDSLSADELAAARHKRVMAACQPLDDPKLREAIESARREREQLIDHINLDHVTFVGYSAQAQEQAQATVQQFSDYIREHKDEIAALGFFYQQPYQRRALTFAMIEELHEALSRPPLMLTTERLWSAYARVQASKVKGADTRRQLTDLIALVRFALGQDDELRPFADSVDKRFQAWIFRHNARRTTAFTEEQTQWLRLVKDHIASSCSIGREDFDYAQLAAKGGLQKAWKVFGEPLDRLLQEMNEELVA